MILRVTALIGPSLYKFVTGVGYKRQHKPSHNQSLVKIAKMSKNCLNIPKSFTIAENWKNR